jgi:hypothetical protein
MECVEASQIKERLLLGRFVTYDVNRDKRTEEWKIIEQQASYNFYRTAIPIVKKSIPELTKIIDYSVSSSTLPNWQKNTLAFSLYFTSTRCSCFFENFLVSKSKEKCEEFKNSIRHNFSRLNQPGNTQGLNCLLNPY